jgi:hypothetical protein
MTRLILVAAGGLLLATANSPPASEGELTSVVAAPAPGQSASPARHDHAAQAVAGAYPRCSATVRDRCHQGRSAAVHPRHREVQYAMRAGERG